MKRSLQYLLLGTGITPMIWAAGIALTQLGWTGNAIITQAVAAAHGSQVKFVSQVVPDNMKAGQTYNVTIQYRNEGKASLSGSYLGSIKPKSKRTWGINVAELPSGKGVAPGGLATFRFQVKAPSRPGNYSFQWQMRDDSRWFGEPTPLMKISVKAREKIVAAEAEFVFQNIPGMKKLGEYYTILERGRSYPVTVMFKNTGTVAWRKPFFSLRAQNPKNNLTWTIDSVELSGDDLVKPGDFKSFGFKILTPLEPGIYNFQWQMYHEGADWFGERSDNVAITVR